LAGTKDDLMTRPNQCTLRPNRDLSPKKDNGPSIPIVLSHIDELDLGGPVFWTPKEVPFVEMHECVLAFEIIYKIETEFA
jgi:hypothetical protein